MLSDRHPPALMSSHRALQPCRTCGLRGPEAQGCLLRAGPRYCALHAPYACQSRARPCHVRAAQALSRLTHLPLITIYLAAGLLSQLFMPGSLHKPLHDVLQPVHDAALGCITLAAGSTVRREWLGASAAPLVAPRHARLGTHGLSSSLSLTHPPAPTHTHPHTSAEPRAGGELVLDQLRANARAIGCITLWLSLASLLLVLPATLFVLVRPRPTRPRSLPP